MDGIGISGNVSLDIEASTVEIDVQPSGRVSIDAEQYVPMRPKAIIYDGSYEVTPSQAAQTLPTRGKLMDVDLVVQPIPNNYGRISYSGGIMTVS